MSDTAGEDSCDLMQFMHSKGRAAGQARLRRAPMGLSFIRCGGAREADPPWLIDLTAGQDEGSFLGL